MGNPLVHFKFGTAEKFRNCVKDPNTIYFITDTETGSHRVYLGDACYNVDVVSDFNDISSSEDVPSATLVKYELSKKSNECIITEFDDTEVPEVITLDGDKEYRYTKLTGCTSVNIKIQNHKTLRFYSSLVLHKVSSELTIKEFVTIEDGEGYPVVFLNGDMPLSENNTLELLFFDNGVNTCCIGAVYNNEL